MLLQSLNFLSFSLVFADFLKGLSVENLPYPQEVMAGKAGIITEPKLNILTMEQYNFQCYSFDIQGAVAFQTGVVFYSFSSSKFNYKCIRYFIGQASQNEKINWYNC